MTLNTQVKSTLIGLCCVSITHISFLKQALAITSLAIPSYYIVNVNKINSRTLSLLILYRKLPIKLWEEYKQSLWVICATALQCPFHHRCHDWAPMPLNIQTHCSTEPFLRRQSGIESGRANIQSAIPNSRAVNLSRTKEARTKWTKNREILRECQWTMLNLEDSP